MVVAVRRRFHLAWGDDTGRLCCWCAAGFCYGYAHDDFNDCRTGGGFHDCGGRTRDGAVLHDDSAGGYPVPYHGSGSHGSGHFDDRPHRDIDVYGAVRIC